MAVNIIQKHGLVPASVFPESDSSGGTLAMNNTLKELLRTAACTIRHKAQQEKASISDLRVYKEQTMSTVWKILAMHLGTPPETFSWDYYDKDSKWQHLSAVTPMDFVAQHVDPGFATHVCLVNDPRNPYMQTYTVDYLQVEAHAVKAGYRGEQRGFSCTLLKLLLPALTVFSYTLCS